MTDEGTQVYGEPAEGRRLIQAFTRVPDPAVREAIIALVERIASACGDDGACAPPQAPAPKGSRPK